MNGLDVDPERYVPCPYNPVHQVKRSRLQAHITKCEKNYPKREACPYNATHRLREKDMANHLETCENKPPENPEHVPLKPTLYLANKKTIHSDEDWDPL